MQCHVQHFPLRPQPQSLFPRQQGVDRFAQSVQAQHGPKEEGGGGFPELDVFVEEKVHC